MESRLIKVQLKTTIQQADDIETFTFNETGTLIQKNGHLYLRFNESVPVETPVLIKLEPKNNIMHLNRQGQSQLNLVLNPKHFTKVHYQTPLGLLPLEVKTNDLEFSLASDVSTGEIKTRYQLYQNQQLVGNYTFHLIYQTR